MYRYLIQLHRVGATIPDFAQDAEAIFIPSFKFNPRLKPQWTVCGNK